MPFSRYCVEQTGTKDLLSAYAQSIAPGSISVFLGIPQGVREFEPINSSVQVRYSSRFPGA